MRKKLLLSFVVVIGLGATTGTQLNAAELSITADQTASTREETVLSDLRLLDIFNVENDAGTTVTIDKSQITYNVPGTYDVKFTETDSSGNTASVTSQLEVTDVLPHITMETTHLNEMAGHSINYINDYGISATEVTGGDMNDQLVIDDSQVDYNHIGTYPVGFAITDEEGNTANASGDLVLRSTPPVVSATSMEHTVALNSNPTDQDLIDMYGVTATDDNGVDYIEADLSAADLTTPGRYNVFFRAYDIYGQVSDDLYAIIEVEDAPALNITANESARTSEEVVLSDLRLLDIFDVQNDPGTTVTIDKSHINYNVPGTYPVTFTETDSSGNTAAVTSQLEVYDRLPQITMESINAQSQVGHSDIDMIDEFGVVGTEAVTGDSTDQIVIDDSEVDYNHVGHYNVYFSLTDEEGNVVNKTGDLELRSGVPTVTADTNVMVPEGSYTDAELLTLFNVVATDSDGIDYITVNSSAVDFNTPGRYTITFTAYDVFGAASEEFFSIIEITDVLPTITTDSEQITVTTGSTLDLIAAFNVVATEITTGDLTDQVVVDDSNLDLTTAGEYTVTFTVSDDEGNTVSKTVTVIVEDEETEGNTCLNNAGHPNNSANCDGTTTCNNNGNNCDKPNNGNSSNSNNGNNSNSNNGNNSNSNNGNGNGKN